MALKYEEAYARVATFAGGPCAIDVADSELWGLEGGILQAVVFHWPAVKQDLRTRLFHKLYGDRVGPYLKMSDGQLGLANDDVVPFALLGRPGLHESGVLLEDVLDAKLEGALFFDLQRGTPNQCPILLWDHKRFGKVASDPKALGLRLATVGGTVSGVVTLVPLKTFARSRDGVSTYWQIEVRGRTAQMQRGELTAGGQREWSTVEKRTGDFPSSQVAKAKAEQLIARYLADGYLERTNFDDAEG